MADRMSPEEAAAHLGRSRSTILRWAAEDRVASVHYLGRVSFAREDIERIKMTGKIPRPGAAKIVAKTSPKKPPAPTTPPTVPPR